MQAGLLPPLTFIRHRLSPLDAFTSGTYFFTMEGGDSEFANFTVSTLKAFLKNVFGNKQELGEPVARAGKPQNLFFPRTRDLLVNRKTTQRHFFSILHHLSFVIFANAAAVVAFLNSRFNVHCYKQCEPKPTQKSAWKWHLRSFATSRAKNYDRHSLVQTIFAVPPNKRWMLTAISCPSSERKQGCPRQQWY